jgi:predicted PurR-regulated permease PerM
MIPNTGLPEENNLLGKTLNIVIKIGLILGLLAWCFLILRPFVMLILWGMVIAVTLYPFFKWLKRKLGGRNRLTSVLVTILVLLIIFIPFSLLAKTFYAGIMSLRDIVESEKFYIPAPAESVKSWPIIGNPIFQLWNSAFTNLDSVITQYKPQIKEFLIWFLGAAKNTSIEFVKLIVSIIISGFFLAYSEQSSKFIRDLFVRLAGFRGHELMESAGRTIRNVSFGIVGVSLIQSFLAGAGFLVAGIPAAGLWALICLFLSIIQIGIMPVCLILVIYVFMTAPTLTAVLFLIWNILIGPLDNILKPVFLGRGSKSPMLIVFLGAIGGFMLNGLIGLFFGAVILSMGYNLFMLWMKESEPDIVSGHDSDLLQEQTPDII